MHFDTSYRKQITSFVKQQQRIAIVGLGNEYRTDDGAGVATIRLLKREGVGKTSRTALFDVNRNLVRYLSEIVEFNPSGLLFVDAANLGIEPGTIMVLNENQIAGQGILTHENNPELAMAYVRMALPECSVLFIGIQFKSLEMSEESTLTKEVKESVASLVELIAEALLTDQS